MKILNTMLGRQAIAAALVLSLAIPMSVGAFAEEPAAAAAADDTVVLPSLIMMTKVLLGSKTATNSIKLLKIALRL